MNVYPLPGLCRLGRSVLDDLADAADVSGAGDDIGVDDAEAVAAAPSSGTETRRSAMEGSLRGRGQEGWEKAGAPRRRLTSASQHSAARRTTTPSTGEHWACGGSPPHSSPTIFRERKNENVLQNDIDLLNPPAELEKKKHKLKRLVQSPNSFFMDVKCQGCFNITTVFSHSQTVVVCGNCQTVLCQPTGGRARLTEGCSFRRKGD
ncbi:40S ribosomal protein S27-2 [Morus notabilis]|uniref:40S ribosomal protein S27 n=1 Tax=Morus notabilis TaxID=981085 RepID=W9RJV2_9ROSA|nr:40S ribosomal protein S27-2 [Morus notabilis]